MIQYEIERDYLKIFFPSERLPYNIPLGDLGIALDWKVAECDDEIIQLPNVAKWPLHLMSSKAVSKEFAQELSRIIIANAPNNKIDWNLTFLAMEIYSEYSIRLEGIASEEFNGLSKLSDYRKTAPQRNELIKELKKKYSIQ